PLGLVHRPVSLLEHLGQRSFGPWRRPRRADAERQPVAAIGFGVDRRQRVAKPRARDALVRFGSTGGERGELVAAETRAEVALPETAAQHVGRFDERAVALGVPERVVDVLEIVEVDESQEQWLPLPAGGPEQLLGLEEEAAPVVQTRQVVPVSQLAQQRLA